MKLTLDEFAALPAPAAVTIHSLERSLYQVTVSLPRGPHVLVDADGRTVRHRDLQRTREMLRTLPVSSITLQQRSAYDEMIGQPPRERDNALSLSLPHEIPDSP